MDIKKQNDCYVLELPLGTVYFDAVDLGLIQSRKWHISRTGYLTTSAKTSDGEPTSKVFHKLIGEEFASNYVDHKNLNKLDNRRENLRLCTPSGNARNRGKIHKSNNVSKYKGLRRRKNRWRAFIMVDYKEIYLGSFVKETDAAAAYDRAALKYHGEFANLNFPNLKNEVSHGNER